MINLSVINLRKIVRNFGKIILTFGAILGVFKITKIVLCKVNFDEINSKICAHVFKDDVIFYSCKTDENEKNDGIKKILIAELSILSDSNEKTSMSALIKEKNEESNEKGDEENETIEENLSEKSQNEILEVGEKSENLVISKESNNLETTVISENNIKEVYTDIYHTVRIKNESKYVLTEKMVTPDIDYLDKKDLIIYHTHTCESYTQNENSQYVASGNYRTLDKNFSVVRVGTELANCMAGKGFNAIHDSTVHDYPVYNGSYTRSLETIKNLHLAYNSVDMVFDIHRDALGSNEAYAPCVKIGEEKVAQLMFVIGTDGGGLAHSNWNSNLKLAIKVQEKANEMYPGLFRPIILRNSRYNQHVTKGSAIIEVGATGNTLEECVGSMKYLANVLEEVMKN